ncbi:Pkinase-domain-containing protein [Dichomitus squalens LYAD-421 SS1]|uniref:Pkinase-domain-containing protein n=1 Tax=Dichomitus squalens (strain LYAD-421) TaxID=732165 RepID=UPI0004415797|nr:Pkinase-domain-containing protein [Dichomitus squalens LYAD-421 SS1]EJF63752.1 Pkinase-domain-containing protein [Dichomitus squalens LYAD-421 SS1]
MYTSPHSTAPDFTGMTIDNGRLRLVQLLGEGAFGLVYRAVDETSAASSCNPEPKQYAVKIMKKVDVDTRRAYFQRREVSTHMSIHDHPNIVSVHGVFECPYYVYLVLELCPGGDLMNALLDRLLYTRKDALLKSVFLQIIQAVEYCHDHGVYHRDLKPDNILVNEDGSEIKLADFGLATTSKVSGTFGCGSGHYMAPECIGLEFDYTPYSTEACDVWSLGIILVNLVAGRNPWTYALSTDRAFSHYLSNPNHMRDVLPVSEEAQYILRGVLNPDPVERWTLQELRQHIEEVETFFMSEEDIAVASKHVQLVAATYCPRKAVEDIARSQSAICIEDARELLAEQFVLRNKTLPRKPLARPQTLKTNDSQQHFVIVSSTGLSRSSSTSMSGEESEGPITPETHAQDPVQLAEVPEFTDSENLGELEVPVQKERSLVVQFPIPPATTCA